MPVYSGHLDLYVCMLCIFAFKYVIHFIVGFESVHLEFDLEAKWTDPELPKTLNKI